MSLRGEDVEGILGVLLDDDPEALYERAPCGYLSTAPDGTVVRANRTFLDLVGYPREDVIGRLRFVDLLSPGGRIYHETHYAPLLRMHGSVREIALDLVRSDGSRLPVLVNSVLVPGDDGRERVIRTAVFDARHRRQYERELLAAKERAEASEARATALARTLQQTLIPPTPPVVPHLDVAAEYRPAGDGSEVGGDFYDVFQTGPDEWVVAIGDVCGKGADAAVVTALVRYTLRAATMQGAPASALRTVNDMLVRHDADRFCTVSCLRLVRSGEAWAGVVCCAGHSLPVVREADGEVRTAGEPGSLLGVLDCPDLVDVAVDLRPGDTLLLYTDGVPEARRGREFYGEHRLFEVVARSSGDATELAAALLADVLLFQSGLARDDIAIVTVQVPPAG